MVANDKDAQRIFHPARKRAFDGVEARRLTKRTPPKKKDALCTIENQMVRMGLRLLSFITILL